VICTLPCSELAELLLPEGLQRVLNIPTTAPITVAQDINKNLMHTPATKRTHVDMGLNAANAH
ncbi:hypothetical protein MJM04_30845, partial [Salmonella enterica subsp. enterica serovar Cerro]|nr:hypothetical protein [Salmonella enterica subsp. enterica serovar Cerro]